MSSDIVINRPDSALNFWRRYIFKRLFGFIAILCIPVYITSVYLCFIANIWSMVIFDTLAYALLLIILFYPRLSDRLRYSLGCMLAYFTGIAFLISIGPTGAGFFWAFIFPPLTSILLGYRASLAAQLLNLISLMTIGFAYHGQWLDWPSLPEYNFFIWNVVVINFVVTNALLTLSIFYLIKKLSESLELTQASRKATVMGLAMLAEYRDNETGAHLTRMCQYSKLLARHLSLEKNPPAEITEQFINDISLSAILHDIGKVGIADAVLLKPGPLSNDEYEKIKAHSKIGEEVLHELQKYAPNCSFIQMGKEIASSHHERWDGTGYPYRLQKDAIPLAARIVALVDVYDALTSHRCYKNPVSHNKAVQLIYESKGTHFDPKLVDVFLAHHSQYETLLRSQQKTDHLVA